MAKVLLNVAASANTAARRVKPCQSSMPPYNKKAATKYMATGLKLSCSTCTVLMVRNNSAGVSTMKTRLDRSLVASARTQPSRPAMKPMAISRTTGNREDSTR